MGSAIAERLQDAGPHLHLSDPNKSALAPFEAKGGQIHTSALDVANAAPIECHSLC